MPSVVPRTPVAPRTQPLLLVMARVTMAMALLLHLLLLLPPPPRVQRLVRVQGSKAEMRTTTVAMATTRVRAITRVKATTRVARAVVAQLFANLALGVSTNLLDLRETVRHSARCCTAISFL